MNARRAMMFSLRIDIDTFKGLKKGIPRILNILGDFNMKASFYCTLGWHGDIMSTLRQKIRSMRVSTENSFSLLTYGTEFDKTTNFLDETKRLFFPRRFGSELELLRRISREGHEVGPHGYVHKNWLNITADEMHREFEAMVSEYCRIFGVLPRSWSAPFGVINDSAIRLTEAFGLNINSYLGGKEIFHPLIDGSVCHHVMVPVTIEITKRHIPPLHYFSRILGISDRSSVRRTARLIDTQICERGWASTFAHAEFEGFERPDLLRRLLKHVHSKGYATKTFLEVAQEYSVNRLSFAHRV
jgi:peptidoglycan/xylan/chitin deacetylase (PgdA/CDA1 family)